MVIRVNCNRHKIWPLEYGKFETTFLLLLGVQPSATLVISSAINQARAKRAGPKGLCAESTRAFTGRWNSHSGTGEDFLSRQPNFFYGNSCNSGTESRKMVSKVGN